MAGRGPAPKDADQRARANVPGRGEWVDVVAPVKPVLPTLASVERTTWQTRTRKMWDAWRKDPATTLFGPAEVAVAIHTAYLLDELVVDGTASLATQVRLHMDGLGLTLKGKRDLRIRVVSEVVEDLEVPVPGAKAKSRYGDLTVIAGGAPEAVGE